VDLALKGLLCTRLCGKGQATQCFRVLILPDGYALLMSLIKGETAVFGCHSAGDMAGCMRKVLAIPRKWCSMCLLLPIVVYSSSGFVDLELGKHHNFKK